MNGRRICVILTLVVLFNGCGEKRAEVRFGYYSGQGPATLPELRVTVRNELHSYPFILKEATQTGVQYTTPLFGTMDISFVIFSDGSATSTMGSIELPLKPDWRWGVNFHIQKNNPFDICMGCFGFEECELDPVLGFDSSMKLWIVWGGNSISDPVVY